MLIGILQKYTRPVEKNIKLKKITTKEHEGFHKGARRFVPDIQLLCVPWCCTLYSLVVKKINTSLFFNRKDVANLPGGK